MLDFSNFDDSVLTWVQLFNVGGERLLYEFSESVRASSQYFRYEPDGGFLKRLIIASSKAKLSEREFWDYGVVKFPEKNRPDLVSNRGCPPKLIEYLWIGNYKDASGRPIPDVVAWRALIHHTHVGLDIYSRHPEWRYILCDWLDGQFKRELFRRNFGL